MRSSPALGPRDPRCLAGFGGLRPEGVCAGELDALTNAVSGPRAFGGAASFRAAGSTISELVPAWENRAEKPREVGLPRPPATPDPRPPTQAGAGRDLSNTTGFGKKSRILLGALSGGRAKLCVYVSQGETEAQRERARWHRENAHGVSKAWV